MSLCFAVYITGLGDIIHPLGFCHSFPIHATSIPGLSTPCQGLLGDFIDSENAVILSS